MTRMSFTGPLKIKRSEAAPPPPIRAITTGQPWRKRQGLKRGTSAATQDQPRRGYRLHLVYWSEARNQKSQICSGTQTPGRTRAFGRCRPGLVMERDRLGILGLSSRTDLSIPSITRFGNTFTLTYSV